MSKPYEVHTYSPDLIRTLLADKANADVAVIDQKRQLTYFQGYLKEMVAQTVVVENDYIDRDYLEDFAGYYVRCFADYPRKCSRLHFFTVPFDAAAFGDMLGGYSSSVSPNTLQNGYLGFTVVKPLPCTVVGRTGLKTYPGEDRRYFPITRRYNVNLFGVGLQVLSRARRS